MLHECHVATALKNYMLALSFAFADYLPNSCKGWQFLLQSTFEESTRANIQKISGNTGAPARVCML